MKNFFFFIGFVLLTVTCKKDADIQSKDYPYVVTGEVSDISNTGATFEAKILDYGKEEITDFGFKWTDGTNEYEISLMNSGNTDDFKVRVSTDLVKDVFYKVCAYVKTNNHLVLGPKVVFRSQGSESPVITSFSPASGLDGTTITISGKYFSNYAEGIRVRIGPEYARVIRSKEDEIVIESPIVSYYGKYRITVEVAGQSVTSSDDYTILGPQVSAVTPADAAPGDILTITGDWLVDSTGGVEISFNDYPAEIVSSGRTKLVVIVPPYTVDFNIIHIKAGLKTLDYPYVVKVTQDFENLTPPGIPGDIDGKACSTQSKGYLFSYGALWEFDPASNAWTNVSVYPGRGGLNIILFSLNDKIYVGGGYGIYGPVNCVDFWEYDPDAKNWKQLPDFPTLHAASGFGLNDKAYILGDINENKLWQYDFGTESWKEMTGPPTIDFNPSLAFVIHNIAYVKTRHYHNNFFEFSESTGDWIPRADCPLEDQNIAFATPDKGYCMTFWPDIFEYNPENDRWVSKKPYPGCPGFSFYYGFSIEDNVYIGNGPINDDTHCQPSFCRMIP
jgi:hypothetical protein